jgi:ABC-type bacteriocin/lantibiotic exporter with double-glycine peptidase domain
VGTGSRGITLLGLRRGADTLGFNARPVKADPKLVDNLKAAPLPMILHWEGNHWVVLYAKKGRKYIIGDPPTISSLVRGYCRSNHHAPRFLKTLPRSLQTGAGAV